MPLYTSHPTSPFPNLDYQEPYSAFKHSSGPVTLETLISL